MTDFTFIQNPITRIYTILAPHRSTRPNEAERHTPFCPFCPGRETDEPELFRIGGIYPDQNWQVKVLNNKYPFTPHHEVIIHSPDHHKNIDELELNQVKLLLQTYKERFKTNQKNGNVYLFHNHGIEGGESLPHPHTQLVVIPLGITYQVQPLEENAIENIKMKHLSIVCPEDSQWPDETWIVPNKRGVYFSSITDEEIDELAQILQKVIQVLSLRHGNEFPYNFYISPEKNWYLRIIPRAKSLGGFEIGTGIFINTQEPSETISFLKEHLTNPNEEKIRNHHQAKYRRGV